MSLDDLVERVCERVVIKIDAGTVAQIWQQAKMGSFGIARLEINIRAYPPSNGRHDLDNITKSIFDALQEHTPMTARLTGFLLCVRPPHWTVWWR